MDCDPPGSSVHGISQARILEWVAISFPKSPFSFLIYNLPSHILLPLRLPRWLSGEEPACQWRRCEFDPWVGKIPWKRKWQPFQYFCWDNPMDRGASQATVHGVTKNQTQFSDSTAANLKTLFLCIVSPRGCKKSDTTAWLMHFTLSLFQKFIVLCSNVCLQVWLPLGFSFQFSEPHSSPHMHTK